MADSQEYLHGEGLVAWEIDRPDAIFVGAVVF